MCRLKIRQTNYIDHDVIFNIIRNNSVVVKNMKSTTKHYEQWPYFVYVLYVNTDELLKGYE